MSQNRLNLDFSLQTREERTQYVQNFLAQYSRLKFSETELETLSNYILWGKNSEGQNGRQEGLDLETRHKTWDSKPVESLESLLEDPAFNEIDLQPLDAPRPRIPPTKFSRSRAQALANPTHLRELESLWRAIDETDYILTAYAGATPREELLTRIAPSARPALEARAKSLTPYSYLKLRHQLVQLRSSQFYYKDSFAPTIFPRKLEPTPAEDPPIFGADICVLPFGLKPTKSSDPTAPLWTPQFPLPTTLSDSNLRAVSSRLWTPTTHHKFSFDFRNESHLRALLPLIPRFRAESTLPQSLYSELRPFLDTFDFYVTDAQLSPIEFHVLTRKSAGAPNLLIRDEINQKYSKLYTDNYISVLFYKKIIPKIASAAALHRELLENCAFPENFKVCKDCGRVYLKDPRFFVKRARSSDGLSPRCKECEKLKRR